MTKRKSKTRRPKPPAYVWADYDPTMLGTARWAFYNTRADQRANRPDLEPIRLRVVLAKTKQL